MLHKLKEYALSVNFIQDVIRNVDLANYIKTTDFQNNDFILIKEYCYERLHLALSHKDYVIEGHIQQIRSLISAKYNSSLIWLAENAKNIVFNIMAVWGLTHAIENYIINTATFSNVPFYAVTWIYNSLVIPFTKNEFVSFNELLKAMIINYKCYFEDLYGYWLESDHRVIREHIIKDFLRLRIFKIKTHWDYLVFWNSPDYPD